ncbi:MAG: hypothetical protein ACJ8G4_03665 [Burkholderiales bacterium]
MRLRGIFLGVAAALLGAAVAHDAYAGGKSGGAARSSASGGARFAAPAMGSMRSHFATAAGGRTVGASPQHFHNGQHIHNGRNHFHSSVAIGVGVPIYYYPGSYYYPGYYYPGYYSPPPPPPGWYFCPAYNAYYPASVPCPSYGPPQGYAPPPPQMYGAPPDAYGVPPDYVPPQ